MSRHRSDTPAARLRDAPRLARRRTRLTVAAVLSAFLLVTLGAVLGLAITAPGPSVSRAGVANALAPATAGPGGPAVPDGRVEDTSHTPRPLPAGWAQVRSLLDSTVRDVADEGYELAACVVAIDSPGEERVCAGEDEPVYSASVIKVAFAVGALEAWDGDPDAETPSGRLGDILEPAITVSDNDAANELYYLTVQGPTAPDTDDPIEALGDIADRVGLDEGFHSGGAFDYAWTGDYSRITARGSAGYLTELVRAADGRAEPGEELTSPEIARQVLALMLRQERDWKLPALLPAGSVANKTGEVDEVSHDIAVVNTASGRYAIAVVSSSNSLYSTPDEYMSELARDVVDALGGPVRF